MTWPYRPYDQGPESPDARVVNIMIPVVTGGTVSHIHIRMTERDARAIVNMTDGRAAALGEFFVLIRDGIASLLRQEG